MGEGRQSWILGFAVDENRWKIKEQGLAMDEIGKVNLDRGLAMDEKGLYLGVEAVLSLVILVMLLSAPYAKTGIRMDELMVMQKAHDLLKVWGMDSSWNEDSMAEDFRFVFPNKGGGITIGGKEVEAAECRNQDEAYFIKGYLIDSESGLEEIVLRIC